MKHRSVAHNLNPARMAARQQARAVDAVQVPSGQGTAVGWQILTRDSDGALVARHEHGDIVLANPPAAPAATTDEGGA